MTNQPKPVETALPDNVEVEKYLEGFKLCGAGLYIIRGRQAIEWMRTHAEAVIAIKDGRISYLESVKSAQHADLVKLCADWAETDSSVRALLLPIIGDTEDTSHRSPLADDVGRALRKLNSDHKMEIATWRLSIGQMDAENTKLRAEIEELQRALRISNESTDLKARLASASEKLLGDEEIEKYLAQRSRELDGMLPHDAELIREGAKHVQAIAAYLIMSKDLSLTKLAKVEEERDALQKDFDQMEESYTSYRAMVEQERQQLRNECERHEHNHKSAEEDVKQLREEVSKKTTEKLGAQMACKQYERDVQSLRTQLDTLRTAAVRFLKASEYQAWHQARAELEALTQNDSGGVEEKP